MSDKTASPELREQLEASHTFRRLTELYISPVKGGFDVEHLKEINRRLFQDLPALGFSDVTPGRFRPAVSLDGQDWIKERSLQKFKTESWVAYSRMDAEAQDELQAVLSSISVSQLAAMKTEAFTAAIGDLYTKLDYLHPFSDGNSRTLREFTRTLAAEAGYQLDWNRFNSDFGREVLYVARDLSVNEIAIDRASSHTTKQHINTTLLRFDGNRRLPDLLRDAIRPTRAVAFEKDLQGDALRKHPELLKAYDVLSAANHYFEAELPSNAEAQNVAKATVRAQIQKELDRGETNVLSRGIGQLSRGIGQLGRDHPLAAGDNSKEPTEKPPAPPRKSPPDQER